MGYDDHGAVRRAQGIDAFGHNAKGVNVKAGIGFIKNAKGRLKHRHLQDFDALFLTARKADIDRAFEHFRLDVEQL